MLLNCSGWQVTSDGAEKEVNEFIDMSSPHRLLDRKDFLLMSEIAVKKGDTFQAKATLQSLIDYYTVKNDGIIDEARKRLAAINSGDSTGWQLPPGHGNTRTDQKQWRKR